MKRDCGLDSGTLSDFILSGRGKPRKPQYHGRDLNQASPENSKNKIISTSNTSKFIVGK